MVHHAAQVIFACMVGADGLTPLRRVKGRKFGTPLAGFRESVKSEHVQSQVHGGTVARVSSRYIVVDFDGRFRMARTIKRANADDTWKVVSPKDPFSAADLESSPAEFTCSRGTRGEVNLAAQRLERHLVQAATSWRTSDRCLDCRALVSGWLCTGPHRGMSNSH